MPFYPADQRNLSSSLELTIRCPIVWKDYNYYCFIQIGDMDFYAWLKLQSIPYSNWDNGDLELGNYLAVESFKQKYFSYYGNYPSRCFT